MESRIPKPKFRMQRSLSATNINFESRSTSNDLAKRILQKPSQSKDTAASLGKTESSHNIVTTRAKENVPVPKALHVRSNTHAAISRIKPDIKTATKRPGTATSSIVRETKRPNIKPITKSCTNLTSRPITATSSTTRNAKPSATQSTTGNVKAKRWDLKGRLEEVVHELAASKEQNKILISRNQELENELSSSTEKEEAYRLNADKFELICHDLKESNAELLARRTALEKKQETLREELEQLERVYKTTEADLDAYERMREEQIAELEQYQTQFDVVEIKNKNLVNEVERLSQHVLEIQNSVHHLDKEKRILHNTIQELKGNIRVFCRVRPKLESENSKASCSIMYMDEFTIEVGRAALTETSNCGGRPRDTRQDFTFDRVFPSTAGQEDIFEEISLLVQSALEGYNVCVFAYGQTGSGKTYTMEGTPGAQTLGMIPRTVRHIFHEKKRLESLGWEYKIQTSFLEIYNEHIVDLLDSHPKRHEIRMTDSKRTDVYVTNLRVEEVHEPEELENWLKIAQENRAVAATFSNERSSRSHSIAQIHLIGTHEIQNESCMGTLNLVDLAGSERMRNEEVARTTETKNINKSLANLGNVILALLKKQDHIPYRNSKLTHLLMSSLGGNSKTLMLLNVSPLDECFNETLNSLRFASNVRNCKTGSVKRTRGVLTNSTPRLRHAM